jgi:hypothetical protein
VSGGYQQQHDEQQQPLPQQELAPGVIDTFCMPGSHVDPTWLLKLNQRDLVTVGRRLYWGFSDGLGTFLPPCACPKSSVRAC